MEGGPGSPFRPDRRRVCSGTVLKAPGERDLNVEASTGKSAALSLMGGGQVCTLLSPHIPQLGQPLRAILSFTHLAGPPKGSLWTGGIVPSGLHMTRQEVQAGSGKQYKTRAG